VEAMELHMDFLLLVWCVFLCTFTPPNMKNGKQISEFKASLVYKMSSRTARAIQRNLVSKNKQNKQTNKKTKEKKKRKKERKKERKKVKKRKEKKRKEEKRKEKKRKRKFHLRVRTRRTMSLTLGS
jgi:outer membrane biosynthesis protein TonB